MKGLVIYKGRYGATKQYAMWVGQELELAVASSDRFPQNNLTDYDYFIIGSSVYLGKLEVSKWLKKNFGILASKKIFLFQVAGTPVNEKEKREKYNRDSIPPALLNRTETYFFPGRMILRNLSGFDRFMLKMGARLTKDPAEKKAMLTEFNDVKKEHTLFLIDAVRKYLTVNHPKAVLA
ncbi:MAG TPA: flavodoxin domain-containing protein [Chitinophagaceae bacterium]